MGYAYGRKQVISGWNGVEKWKGDDRIQKFMKDVCWSLIRASRQARPRRRRKRRLCISLAKIRSSFQPVGFTTRAGQNGKRSFYIRTHLNNFFFVCKVYRPVPATSFKSVFNWSWLMLGPWSLTSSRKWLVTWKWIFFLLTPFLLIRLATAVWRSNKLPSPLLRILRHYESKLNTTSVP